MKSRYFPLFIFVLVCAWALFEPVAKAQLTGSQIFQSRRGQFRSLVFEAFTIPDTQVDAALERKIREEISILRSLARKTSEPNQRADILFRIAELSLLQERSSYFKAMEAYEIKFEQYLKGKRKKKPREPRFTGNRSFKIYKNIIKTAPKYKRLDEVLFLAGFHATERRAKDAHTYFLRLIRQFPRSKFRIDAYMELGENYFLQRKFKKAISAFKTILKTPNRLHNFALYKISWCLYNQGKVRSSMKVMQRVVQSSKGVKREIELREEAMRDLVIFYADLGLINQALQYFASIGEPQYGFIVLEKLSKLYFDQARYPKAIVTLKKLMTLDPYGVKRPKHHSRLIESHEKSQKISRAIKEMESFITSYEKNSRWWQRNTEEEMRTYAYERSEVYARFIAKKYHEFAQKSQKKEPKKSKLYTRSAVRAYQRYLKLFGKHKNAYELRFLYAELLFKNKRYSAAATQFEAVASLGKKRKRHKAALIGQLDALGILEDQHYKKIESKIDKTKRKYDKLILSEHAKKLIKVDGLYASSYPKDPRVPRVLLQHAQLYYNYNHLEKARRGFFNLINKYPTNAASNKARHLVLDIYNIKKDWNNLEKWAEKFLAVRSFATPENRKLLLELIQGSIFQRAKHQEEKKDYIRAANVYEGLIRKYPRSKFADKALFNAAINYINADASEKAMASSRLFLRNYPRSPMVPRMMLAMATYFDDKLDYAHAAQYYELLAEKDPKSKQAPDALFNAGLYHENLRQYSKALKNYDTYLKRYPRKKDAADIFFARGIIYEKRRNWGKAAKIYRAYTRKYGSNRAKVVEAYYRWGQMAEKYKDSRTAARAYRSAVSYARKRGVNSGVGGSYAAKAAFERTQASFKKFKSIRLRMPQRVLTKAIERKALLLKQLKDRYLEIINFGDAETGVKALYHIGLIYQQFSQALFNAPIPRGLSPEEVQIYQQELQNRATPIEEKSVEAYEKAVKKAFELEVYNKWAKKSYNRLTQYRPDVYPPRRGYTNIQPSLSEPLAAYVEKAGRSRR